jgi:hypothetical protein
VRLLFLFSPVLRPLSVGAPPPLFAPPHGAPFPPPPPPPPPNSKRESPRALSLTFLIASPVVDRAPTRQHARHGHAPDWRRRPRDASRPRQQPREGRRRRRGLRVAAAAQLKRGVVVHVEQLGGVANVEDGLASAQGVGKAWGCGSFGFFRGGGGGAVEQGRNERRGGRALCFAPAPPDGCAPLPPLVPPFPPLSLPPLLYVPGKSTHGDLTTAALPPARAVAGWASASAAQRAVGVWGWGWGGGKGAEGSAVCR